MRTLLVRVCGLDVSRGSCLVSRLPEASQALPVEGAGHAAAVQAGIKAADEALAQVAETEAQLARRLVDRKTEPLVRAL